MISRLALDPYKKFMSDCIQLRPRNSAYLMMKTIQGSSPAIHTGHIHSAQHLLLGFHDTRNLSVSEDTKHPGIVLDNCVVSRLRAFFSRNFCVMGYAPECLFGSKSQSKSEFTLSNMYSKRTRSLE